MNIKIVSSYTSQFLSNNYRGGSSVTQYAVMDTLNFSISKIKYSKIVDV